MAMDLETLGLELQDAYDRLGAQFSEGQRQSGLLCPTDCGQCCRVPTVEASPLELLPMALELLRQGLAEAMYQRLLEERPTLCPVFTSHSADGSKGSCSLYRQRPTVCRLFGVAARPAKHGGKELSICRELKTLYPTQWEKVESEAIPLMTEASWQLATLHPDLLSERRPISISLRKILEIVLLHHDLQSK